MPAAPGCLHLALIGAACASPRAPLPLAQCHPPPPTARSCYNWIDRRAHYSRWLTLDCVEERAVYAGGAKQASPALGATWTSAGLPAAQLSGGHLAAGVPRHLQYPGSPGTYYQRQVSSPGSPGSGGSPHLRAKARRSPLGSPGLGVAQQWGGGGSPPAPAMLRSGDGMPGSPLIGARR